MLDVYVAKRRLAVEGAMAELNSSKIDTLEPGPGGPRAEPQQIETKVKLWSNVVVGMASSLTSIFVSAGIEGPRTKLIGFVLATTGLVFAAVALKLRAVTDAICG